MKVKIATVHYASLENTHPVPAVTIREIDVPRSRSLRFGQGQTLNVEAHPFALKANVIVDGDLIRREESSNPPRDIYQITFRTGNPHKAKVVSIFP